MSQATMSSDFCIGIDFGNERCFISKNRLTEAIPSYILFGEKNRKFGEEAHHLFMGNIANTVYSFKRFLGGNFHDPVMKREKEYVTYKLCETDDGIGVEVECFQKRQLFSMIQITAMLLEKLKQVATQKFKENVTKCVIAIPSYFTNTARLAMMDAAKIAGLKAQLIHDTTAVALLFRFSNGNMFVEDVGTVVAIIDMGHSSLQVAICEISRTKIEVLSMATSLIAGGREIDVLMAEHFIENFQENSKCHENPSKKSYLELLQQCRKLKHQLSDNVEHDMPIEVDNFINNKKLSDKMNKKKLDKVCKTLGKEIENTMNRALSRSELLPKDVNQVEMVGGSTRVPMVKYYAERVFGCIPNFRLGQDDAVAKGCVCQSVNKAITIEDILPYPIKVYWPSKLKVNLYVLPIFNVNSRFPSKKSYKFDKSGTAYVGYGESFDSVTPATMIGYFSYSSSKTIDIRFSIDANGLIQVSLENKNSSGKYVAHFPILSDSQCKKYKETELSLKMKDAEENNRILEKNNLQNTCFKWKRQMNQYFDFTDLMFLKEYILWFLDEVLNDLDNDKLEIDSACYLFWNESFQITSRTLEEFVNLIKEDEQFESNDEFFWIIFEIIGKLCSEHELITVCFQNIQDIYIIIALSKHFLLFKKSSQDQDAVVREKNEILEQVHNIYGKNQSKLNSSKV